MAFEHAWTLNVFRARMVAEHDYAAGKTRVTMVYDDGTKRHRTGRLATDPGAIGDIANRIPAPTWYRTACADRDPGDAAHA